MIGNLAKLTKKWVQISYPLNPYVIAVKRWKVRPKANFKKFTISIQ